VRWIEFRLVFTAEDEEEDEADVLDCTERQSRIATEILAIRVC
jgi:hypothetical protein